MSLMVSTACNRGGLARIAHHEGQVLDLIDPVLVGDDAPLLAIRTGIEPLLHPFDQFFGSAAMRDQIGDGAEFEIMPLRESHQIRQPGHGAVIVHDLADDAGGDKAGKAGDVHRCLGMAGADQGTAIARHQREDMARGDDIPAVEFRIDGDRYGAGAVRRRDAGGDTLARLDGDREGGFVPGAVRLAHHRQPKPFTARFGHGETDQPAGVLGHEVDGIRGRELRRYDQITLVLAILVIDQNKNSAGPRLIDDLGGGRDIVAQASLMNGVHRLTS